jgi:hypothetical protein
MTVISGFRKPEPVQIKGRSTAGPIPLSGVIPGNSVFAAINIATGANETATFESTISVAGQIQQTSTADKSANEYWIYSLS